MHGKNGKAPIYERFRGFLPVVVDLETGGFNCKTDALLEIAAVLVDLDDQGLLHPGECFRFHVKPFEGANQALPREAKEMLKTFYWDHA